jgi:PKD repeat protein
MRIQHHNKKKKSRIFRDFFFLYPTIALADPFIILNHQYNIMKKILILFFATFLMNTGFAQNIVTVSGNFSNNGVPRASELIQLYYYSLDSNSTAVIVDTASTDAMGNYFLSENLPFIYSQGYVRAVASDCNNSVQTKILGFGPANYNLVINFNCLPVSCYNYFKYYVDTIFNNNYQVNFESGKQFDANDLYTWDFGDGNSAQGKIVSHNYTQSGTYTVCLTTFNSTTNCTNVYCDSIFVYNPINYCYASFVPVLNPITSSIDFYAYSKSDSNVVYNWDFGDGVTATGPIVSHKYLNEGIYTVCLTVYDSINSCVSSYCSSVTTPSYQMDSCIADFKLFIVPDSSSQGASTVYFSLINYTFATTAFWDFGDGSTAIGNTITHTYSGPGTYLVKCIRFDSLLQCVDTVTKQLLINGGELKVISLGLNDEKVTLNNLYPNPVLDKLNINISSTETQLATIRIMDLTGKVLITEKTNLIQGSNLIELNTSDLNSGIYLVEIVSKSSYSASKLLK